MLRRGEVALIPGYISQLPCLRVPELGKPANIELFRVGRPAVVVEVLLLISRTAWFRGPFGCASTCAGV